MKILKNITNSPTENGSLRASRIPRISVPSKAPPLRITIPTPIPRMRPPKTVASNGSSVRAGTWCKVGSINARAMILNRDAITKLFPIYL